MRELALVTLRIVDETIQFQPEDVVGLYTPDYPNHNAATNMRLLTRDDPQAGVVWQSAEGDTAYQPVAQMVTLRVEPCNLDSVLGAMVVHDEEQFVSRYIAKLGNAGLRLLDHENDDRNRLHEMSKALGGDGVEPTDMVQFYAVFSVVASGSCVDATLEGVLRLDKIDMAIDEAVLL